ncbi:MAG: tetratricopeptide repeat protein [Candidatus Cloacimonadota bacterium]|nr:tetratricopeptide repeat protein [Candidatus Cloacimonadota bacterium]
MKFKKEKLAFGIFQDGLSIKVAQLALENGKIKIQRLEETELSSPLYPKEITEEEKKSTLEESEFTDLEEEELNIPEVSEFDEKESFEEIEKEKAISGKSDLQKLLLKFPIEKGKIALNANEEQISYKQFDEIPTAKIKKRIKSELLSKEEIQSKDYELSYILNPDKTILAFVHRGKFELLNVLQDTNLVTSKKKFFYSFIDTNEISLINLVRTCYDFPPEDYVLILYIGVDYRVEIVMKGKNYHAAFPIIVTETKPEKMRQAIYSKIILEQDVSNIPITKHIILAGEHVSDEDIESFREKCDSGSTINRLELGKIGIIKGKDEITPEKIAQYAIPIALAWKTLEPKNKDFFPSNLLPSKIIESQKHFKIAWHGFIVLAAIFYFALTGTIKNMNLKQEALDMGKKNINLEIELKKIRVQIARLNKVKRELAILEKNVKKIEKLTGNKNQWHYILNVIANSFLENKVSWITNLKSSENNFQISGYTTKKRNIIKFSKLFPGGRIERITEHSIQDLPIWKYDMTFSYPNPKDTNKEKEESLSEIHIAEVPEKSSEPITEKPVEPEIYKETSEKDKLKIYNSITKLYFASNSKEAYERFQEFVLEYPEYKYSYNANYLMGECLYTMGKISEAKDIFENILKQNGAKTPDALIMLGNSCQKLNDINTAIYYWNKLVTDYPNNKLAKIAQNKINTFSKTKDTNKEKTERAPEAAINKIIEKSASKTPQNEYVSYKKNNEKNVFELQLISRKNLSKVEEAKNKIEQHGYKTKVSSVKKDGEIFYRLRLDSTYTKSEAVAIGKKIKEQFPFINSYWIEKLEYNENIPEIYQSITKTYFSGNIEKAYKELNKFIENYPTHPLAYNASYLIGECLYRLDKISRAKSIFENVIKLKGTKTSYALMMLGNSYQKLNDINTAIYYWNKLVTDYPNNKLSKIAQYKINVFGK